MQDPLMRERLVRPMWPGRLALRKERRALRRISLPILILLAVVVGATPGWGRGMLAVALSVGRALAGLTALGLAGLMVGVVLTALAVFVYNGILRGRVSLLDLQYIDEIPLVFAVTAGIAGIFLSLRWPEPVGLAGWGLAALVLSEALFRKPTDNER